MNFPLFARRETPMMLSISLYMYAYEEVADALRWTISLLLKVPDDAALTDMIGNRDVPVYCALIQMQLEELGERHRPSAQVIADTLRDCIAADVLFRRVINEKYSLENSDPNRTPSVGFPETEALRRQAGETIGLAIRVLNLHVLQRRASPAGTGLGVARAR